MMQAASTASTATPARQLRWTASACRALGDIRDRIAADRPTTAQRTLESIIDRVQALIEFPDLGPPYPHRPNVRILSYGRFRIPYLIDGDLVIVLGVLR